MTDLYTPENWFWIVGGDTSRAWSSAASAYVNQWDAARVTRIASEAELNDVLKPYGLRGPLVTAQHIKDEAQRRIIAITGKTTLLDALVKQSNANMRANELNDIRHDREWTPAEAAEATALRQLATAIKAVRARSDVLEQTLPADYTNDAHWA